jgi:hypothetical protein
MKVFVKIMCSQLTTQTTRGFATGRGAVEDRRRWWLEQAGWRGGAVAPPAAGGGGRRLDRRRRRGRRRGRNFRDEEDVDPRKKTTFSVVSAHGPRPIKFTLCGAWSGTTRLEYRRTPLPGLLRFPFDDRSSRDVPTRGDGDVVLLRVRDGPRGVAHCHRKWEGRTPGQP